MSTEFTSDELGIISMCILKEIGRNRMNMLSDSYIYDDEIYSRIEKFTTRLEELSGKIDMIKMNLDNEDLK